jgi:hypothetical protein
LYALICGLIKFVSSLSLSKIVFHLIINSLIVSEEEEEEEIGNERIKDND